MDDPTNWREGYKVLAEFDQEIVHLTEANGFVQATLKDGSVVWLDMDGNQHALPAEADPRLPSQ